MKMRVGFLLLIGLPGSGKTTLAKNLIKNFEQNSQTFYFIHVCYDDLIPFRNGNFEFEWRTARNLMLVKIKELILAIKNKNTDLCPLEFKNYLQSVKSWECDFIIIIDDNLYFKSMRYCLFQIARKYQISFSQIYIKCSLENALLRNAQREQDCFIPSHVIETMHSKIEPPNCKNNWEKYSLELQEMFNLNEVYNKIFLVLNESLNNFFDEKHNDEMKQISQLQSKKSVLHQADIALRKIVGIKIKKYISENSNSSVSEKSKNYVEEINLRKSELLLDIKTGNICLSDEILAEINSDALEKIKLINFLGTYL